ncbi:CcmD family protein [Virgibacillus oceani]
MTYLVAGVLILWGGILIYMSRLYSQQKKLARRLNNLK